MRLPYDFPDQNVITSFIYNEIGQLLETIDVLGRRSVNQYDSAGNVILTVANYAASAPIGSGDYSDAVYNSLQPDQNIRTAMIYDAAGRLVSSTDVLGRVTRYDYDGDSRITKVITNYQTGIYNVANPDQDLTTQYAYDANGNVITIIDTLGRITHLCYDQLSRPVRYIENLISSDPCSASFVPSSAADTDLVTNLTYDNNGNVVDVVDPHGIRSHYIYDALNRQVAVVHNFHDGIHDPAADPPDQDVISVTVYDAVGNVQKTIDSASRETWMCYDSLNRRTRVVVNATADPCNGNFTPSPAPDFDLVTDYTYDALGHVIHVTDPVGRITLYEYNSLGQVIRAVSNFQDGVFNPQNPDEDVVHQTIYDPLGRVQSTIDPLGRQTRYIYDNLDRQIAVVHNFQDGIYDPNAPDVDVTEVYSYDGAGRLVNQTDPNGNTTSYVYDRANRMTQIIDPLNRITLMSYDGSGSLRTVVDPLNQVTNYVYDNANRQINIITQMNFSSTTAYDRMGRIVSRTDGNGIQTRFEYDSLGRITGVLENSVPPFTYNDPNFPDRNVFTTYDYDVIGNLVSITLPTSTLSQPAVVTYGYDALNRRIFTDGPLTSVNDLWITNYDKAGRIISAATPNSNSQQSFVYDGLDRLIGINYVDSVTPNVAFSYDAVGRRQSMTDGLGTTQYSYDNLDRILSVNDPLNQVMTYAYDAGGRRTKLDMPGGRTINYSYDPTDQLQTVTSWNAASVSYTYDNGGRLTGMALPNGVVAEYVYDVDNRMTSVRYLRGTQAIAQYDYQMDNVGYRTSVLETALQPLGVGRHPATHTDIMVTGEWTEHSNANAIDGVYTATTETGAEMTFAIQGTGVNIYHLVSSGAWSSRMEVCVSDGLDVNECSLFDNNAPQARWNRQSVIGGLPFGDYTVKVRHLGDAGLAIMSVEVLDNANNLPLGVGYYVEQDPRIQYRASGSATGAGWRFSYNEAMSGGEMRFTRDTTGTIRFDVDVTEVETIVIHHPKDAASWDPLVVCGTICASLDVTGGSGFGHLTSFTVAELGLDVNNPTVTISFPVPASANRGGLEALELRGSAQRLAVGRHLATHADIMVTGEWTEHSNANAIDGVYTATTETGAEMTFAIQGTGVNIYHLVSSEKIAWSSRMEVCVSDGLDVNECSLFDNNAPQARWNRQSVIGGLPFGDYTVRIRHLGDAGLAIMSVEVLDNANNLPLGVGYYVEQDPRIQYRASGSATGAGWRFSYNEAMSGGEMRFTRDTTGTIRFDVDVTEVETIVIHHPKDAASWDPLVVCGTICASLDVTGGSGFGHLTSFTVAQLGLDVNNPTVTISFPNPASANRGGLEALDLLGGIPELLSPPETETPTITPMPLHVTLPFVENFDTGANWIASQGWSHLLDGGRHNGGWFADTMTYRVPFIVLEYDGLINLEGATNPQISLWHKAELSNVDVVAVDIVPQDGEHWVPIYQQSGWTGDWTEETVNLSAYSGQMIRLRIRVDAMGVVPEGQSSVGYWIDELMIADVPLTPTATATLTPGIQLPTLEATVTLPGAEITAEVIPTGEPTVTIETPLPTITETPEPTATIETPLPTATEMPTWTPEPTPAQAEATEEVGKPVKFADLEPLLRQAIIQEQPGEEVTPEVTAQISPIEDEAPVDTEDPAPIFELEPEPDVQARTEQPPFVDFDHDEAFVDLPLLTMSSQVDPVIPSVRTITYQYDGLYRLTGADYCDGINSAPACTGGNITRSYAYSYDLMGNRLTANALVNGVLTSSSYTYNTANQIVTQQISGDPLRNFVYDPAGNLVDDGLRTYAYDAGDRLIGLADGITSHTYAYDGLGNRYRQTVDGIVTNYLLDSTSGLTQVLGEFGPDDDIYYLLGLDIIGQQQGTDWTYFGHDALGSVRMQTGANGGVTYRASYDPYGTPIEQLGAATRLGFTGEYTDPTGLVYLRARYMNPATATFLTMDPFEGIMNMSVSRNGYLYAHGNPINLTDPSGLFPPALAVAVLGGGGALLAGAAAVGAYLYLEQALKNTACAIDPMQSMCQQDTTTLERMCRPLEDLLFPRDVDELLLDLVPGMRFIRSVTNTVSNLVTRTGVRTRVRDDNGTVRLYRGSNTSMDQITYQGTGYIMSDAARDGWEMGYGTLTSALTTSQNYHNILVNSYGSEITYASAHWNDPVELAQRARRLGVERTFVSFTEDPHRAEVFRTGGYIYWVDVRREELALIAVPGSPGEREWLVRHMIRVDGRGSSIAEVLP